MDDAMRDTFARQGYIVVPDVLNQQQLDELNQVYDQHIYEREETQSEARTDKQNRKSIRERDKHKTTDRHGNTYVGRRLWSKAYRDLIDNETMLPIIEELLGDPSWGHASAHMPASRFLNASVLLRAADGLHRSSARTNSKGIWWGVRFDITHGYSGWRTNRRN